MPTPQRIALTTLLLFLVACTDTPTSSPPNLAALSPDAAGATSSAGLDQPLSGLSASELARFDQGRDIFEKVFDPIVDGLGPLFNEVSCEECHEDPTTGGTGDEVETHVSNVSGTSCDDLSAHGGAVIQQHLTDGLAAYVGYTSEPLPSEAVVVAHRTTPQVFGRGLLDAVSDAEILSRADPNDANGDGVSGRASILSDGRIGRFGRKATDATLLEFNAGAFQNEMGVTNPLAATEPQLVGTTFDTNLDPTSEPELSMDDLTLANDFVRFLRAPPQAVVTGAATSGRELFASLGCATCHVPTLNTGASPVKALNRKSVNAFSDLLLHDMGQALSDICRGGALPSEFRTEPLMGLGSRTKFLHDGRSTTVEDAILQHGGEATNARNRYTGLKANQRSALLAYLATL
jgi:CxxC motif-containing protein (DUF1111 family)